LGVILKIPKIQANSAALKAQKLRCGIMRKKPKGKAMSHWNKMCNKAINKRLNRNLNFFILKMQLKVLWYYSDLI
jgi:hypothetical protein